jgi:DNA-binding GntR family transcriptional regulator
MGLTSAGSATVLLGADSTRPYSPAMTSVSPSGEPITVDSLYELLRHRILAGELRPGAILSQVKLADAFGTGRTPLREALRMLQREGLVDAEYNRRVRVAALTTSELDEIYARRVVLEAMAVRASIPRFTLAELDELQALKAEMESFMPDPAERLQEWEAPHRAFHQLLVRHAGASIVSDVEQLQDHAERYRAILGSSLPGAFAPGAADHAQLVVSCIERDPREAGRTLARHLARAGLALLSQTDPTHDAVALREALRLVLGDEPGNSLP